MIKIVEIEAYRCLKKTEVDKVTIGQKAWGLCQMPVAWTPPFFVISQEAYLNISKVIDCQKSYKKEIFRILQMVEEENLGDEIIIRSSGLKEGMEERGKYESTICNISKLGDSLKELIMHLNEDDEINKVGIPLVVQKYIKPDISGHLSNERRISKEHRDFIYELEVDEMGAIETGEIHLRNWRKKYDWAQYKDIDLCINNLDEALRIVSAYYYDKQRRVHIEFVYGNSALYLVQCDYASNVEGAVNPDEFEVKVNYDKTFEPKLLRLISSEDKGKYEKINNVLIYQELGELTPKLYILDDKSVFKGLIMGDIEPKLEHDLNNMLSGSVIIRTNIVSDELKDSQLSKRSNEVRTFEDAIAFLKEACIELEALNVKDYIFILHNFIPAKAAAFVNAQPMNEFVEIQALWGLPEGLYYNAYDIIEVDTKSINYINMDKEDFLISEHPAYKEHFIAPDIEGNWVIKKLDAPYDWKCTLSNPKLIKDIAYRSRVLAEHLNEELSIMWFIGIDEDYYGVDCIPWYHEKYSRNSFYSTSATRYKKKYFSEKEFTIVNENDIETLKTTASNDIKIVKIQPVNDKLLRSKEFINDIGNVCKDKNISILLEGASLAHTFYQLVSTGANVLTTYKYKKMGETLEFNKLVRDKIPEIIKKNGENISITRIVESGLKKALKEKLLEEAYEVLDAKDILEVLEELADLEEVCLALEKIEDVKEFSEPYVEKIETPLFEFNLDLIEGQRQTLVSKFNNIYVKGSIERIKSMLQIVFILSETCPDVVENKMDISLDRNKKLIIDQAFEVVETSDVEMNKMAIHNMREAKDNIIKQNNISRHKFEEIRKNKETKKGGFSRGYVLHKTFRGFSEDVDLLDGVDLGEPNLIYELREHDKIDIDHINGNRLLIRLSFPLYSKKNVWQINRNKINEFFGRETTLRIKKQIKNCSLLLDMESIFDEYEQMEILL